MNLTDYAENQIVDWLLRAQTITLPTNWYFALASAADDTGITELSGTGYARQAVTRSLAAFLDTQGAGGGVASTGTTHATSNVADINWGNPGAAWGTANYVGIMDASSAGNCWFWLAIPAIAITTGSPNPCKVAAGALQIIFGLTSGCSDWLANNVIDKLFRAQTFAPPTSVYLALFTAAPTSAGGGTEVSGGSYARAALTLSLANMSGTQAPGSTVASTGTTGRSSINAALAFPAPTAGWGTVVACALMDAASAGHQLFNSALTASQSVSSGGPAPTFAPDKYGVTVS